MGNLLMNNVQIAQEGVWTGGMEFVRLNFLERTVEVANQIISILNAY